MKIMSCHKTMIIVYFSLESYYWKLMAIKINNGFLRCAEEFSQNIFGALVKLR